MRIALILILAIGPGPAWALQVPARTISVVFKVTGSWQKNVRDIELRFVGKRGILRRRLTQQQRARGAFQLQDHVLVSALRGLDLNRLQIAVRLRNQQEIVHQVGFSWRDVSEVQVLRIAATLRKTGEGFDQKPKMYIQTVGPPGVKLTMDQSGALRLTNGSRSPLIGAWHYSFGGYLMTAQRHVKIAEYRPPEKLLQPGESIVVHPSLRAEIARLRKKNGSNVRYRFIVDYAVRKKPKMAPSCQYSGTRGGCIATLRFHQIIFSQ